jgi:LPS export ABC transporter protein LptC
LRKELDGLTRRFYLTALSAILLLGFGVWWIKGGQKESRWLNIFPEANDNAIVATEVIFRQGNDSMKSRICVRNEDTGKLVLKEVFVSFLNEQGVHYTLVSDEAEQEEKTEVIEFRGNVVLTSDDGKKMFTEQLFYRRKEGIVRCPGLVKIVESGTVTTGDEFFMDLKRNQSQIRGHVRILVQMGSS